jgi:metal-responsive CopG/Arc/MetJ family transcriptional regulator
MKNLCIMGILVDKRTQSAPRVQEILTKHGDSILSRVGIHDPGEEQHGLITLNIRDKRERIDTLAEELQTLEGVTVKTVTMK